MRKSLLGNSFSCSVVARLVSHLLSREGLAVRPATPTEAGSGKRLELGCLPSAQALQGSVPPQRGPRPTGLQLVERLGTGVDHRGSDVRLALGPGLRPSAWPRRETPARWWTWRTVLSFAWQVRHAEHIHALEIRATLAALRWRSRQRRFLARRALHLSDSYVAIGVLTKRRSASLRLSPVVRRVNALELASGIHLCHAFTCSADNPADAPSRLASMQSRFNKRRLPHRQ